MIEISKFKCRTSKPTLELITAKSRDKSLFVSENNFLTWIKILILNIQNTKATAKTSVHSLCTFSLKNPNFHYSFFLIFQWLIQSNLENNFTYVDFKKLSKSS